MFKSMDSEANGESLPSWLKQGDNTTDSSSKETNSNKTKGAGNKSYGSTNPALQEFYGEEDAPTMPPYSPPPPPRSGGSGLDEEDPEPLWAKSNNGQKEEVEEEESEEEESEEEESEEEESSEEEEEEDSEEEESEDDSEEEESEEEEDNTEDWAKGSEKENLIKKKRGKNSSPPKYRKPLRNCCHSFFILIQMIAIFSNLAMIGVQLIPIFTWNSMILENKVIRWYLAFFNLMFILAEFDLDFIGLKNWMKRGILYTFIGCMALDQRESLIKFGFLNTKNDTSFDQTWNELWASIIIQGTSLAIIAIGCIYFFLEIICMRGVRNRCRVEYRKRMAHYKKKMKK